jgi:hypothetical protein
MLSSLFRIKAIDSTTSGGEWVKSMLDYLLFWCVRSACLLYPLCDQSLSFLSWEG